MPMINKRSLEALVFVTLAGSLTSCSKEPDFSGTPVEQVEVQIIYPHNELDCRVREFGKRSNLVVKQRYDEVDFGTAYIATLSRNDMRIIIFSPFSPKVFILSAYAEKGSTLDGAALDTFRRFSTYLSSSIPCLA